MARSRTRRRSAAAARRRARGELRRPPAGAHPRRGSRCVRRRRSTSPTRSACGRAPSNRCTTSASSAAGPPVLRRRYTARRKDCRPSSSSAKRPAAKPARARRSRTTSGSRRASSGADLTHRAVAQARRFGAEMVLARDVVGFESRGPVRAVHLADDAEIEARDRARRDRRVVPAARRPGARRAHRPRRLLRRRPRVRRASCEGEDVYVVGAANSAGQAALNLAPLRPARHAARPFRLAGEVDVASISSSASPARRTSRSGCRPRSSPGAATTTWSRSPSPTAARAPRKTSRRTGCSCTSALRRAPIGSATASPATSTGFVITGTDLLTRKELPRWPLRRMSVRPRNQRARACSRRATCASTR